MPFIYIKAVVRILTAMLASLSSHFLKRYENCKEHFLFVRDISTSYLLFFHVKFSVSNQPPTPSFWVSFSLLYFFFKHFFVMVNLL